MRTILVALGLLFLAIMPVAADEGRTPIYQPGAISQAGNYVVTRNLNSTGSSVLSVSGSGLVILDLNGFSLTGTGATTIGIILSGNVNAVIRNGSVSGYYGIEHNSQPQVAGRIRLENLTIAGTNQSAISMSTPALIDIVDCKISSVLQTALSVYNPGNPGSFTGHILRNRIESSCTASCFGSVFSLDGIRGGDIRENVVTASSGSAGDIDGPNGGGNVIEGNTFIGPFPMIVGSSVGTDNNLILDNTFVSTSNGTCLQIGSAGNRIAGNVVGPGCSDGITFNYNSTFRNLIEGNQVQGNSGCGLKFSFASTNAYRNNMLRGNTGGTVCGVANTDAGGNIF